MVNWRNSLLCLWLLGVFFSAAPTTQNSPELHFCFINSFIQSSLSENYQFWVEWWVLLRPLRAPQGSIKGCRSDIRYSEQTLAFCPNSDWKSISESKWLFWTKVFPNIEDCSGRNYAVCTHLQKFACAARTCFFLSIPIGLYCSEEKKQYQLVLLSSLGM